MSLGRGVAKGVKALRPFVDAVRGADVAARAGGEIAILDGEPRATERLRAILGVPVDVPLRSGAGLLVYAAVEGHDPSLAADVLAEARAARREVLAVIVGAAPVRRALEKAILRARPLEPSNVAHVASLDDPAPVLAAVARVLGDEAIAAARRHPPLRDAVADAIVSRAARQAATVGGVAVVPGADLPVITVIQVRMVAQLAALHGRPLDVRRGLEVAGVLAGAFGWRALARRATIRVPVAGFAVRAGVGYSATMAVGRAARTYFAQAGDRADAPLEGLQAALQKASRRGRR